MTVDVYYGIIDYAYVVQTSPTTVADSMFSLLQSARDRADYLRDTGVSAVYIYKYSFDGDPTDPTLATQIELVEIRS